MVQDSTINPNWTIGTNFNWSGNFLKMSAEFRFSIFRLWPFHITGIKIGSKRPQLVLKHTEKQSETRRVQSFGAKSGASAAEQKTLYARGPHKQAPAQFIN